jgi:hypothetical protein
VRFRETERRGPTASTIRSKSPLIVLDDVGGAETVEELLRCRDISHERGDFGAALTGQSNPQSPDESFAP